ncbi:hypothetical protein BBBOND_0208150 [Babesia bigemina]|uniref:Uncharacterized protein n=1 Tax=Babesia bigemina TaxID=5866 RepID=A0A061D4L8_BABBI|nr:hypothetical protein BBBOND_0208150 [Babesia bigemina]CDR95661.1 hypothetical protein BBBOND_0208150 [Babesia bigemina]|eukprot:XP_012767847.1 hypothetical protein BBBOND_0208150 [Babesia bigemina]
MRDITYYRWQVVWFILCFYTIFSYGLVMRSPAIDDYWVGDTMRSKRIERVRELLNESSVSILLNTLQVFGNQVGEILRGDHVNNDNVLKGITDRYPTYHELHEFCEGFSRVADDQLTHIRNAWDIYTRYNDIKAELGKIDLQSPRADELIDERNRLESQFEMYVPFLESALRVEADKLVPIAVYLLNILDTRIKTLSSIQKPAESTNGAHTGKTLQTTTTLQRRNPKTEDNACICSSEWSVEKPKDSSTCHTRDAKSATKSSGHTTLGWSVIQTLSALAIMMPL